MNLQIGDLFQFGQGVTHSFGTFCANVVVRPNTKSCKLVICSSLAKESPTALAPSAPMLLSDNTRTKLVICSSLAKEPPTALRLLRRCCCHNTRTKLVICSSLAKEPPTALAPSAPIVVLRQDQHTRTKLVICWNLATASPTTLAPPGPRLLYPTWRCRVVTFSGFGMASKIVVAATHSKWRDSKTNSEGSRCRAAFLMLPLASWICSVVHVLKQLHDFLPALCSRFFFCNDLLQKYEKAKSPVALGLLNLSSCCLTASGILSLQMFPQIIVWKGVLQPVQGCNKLVANCQLLCICSVQGLLKKPLSDLPGNPMVQPPSKRNSQGWDTDVYDHCEGLEPICQRHQESQHTLRRVF